MINREQWREDLRKRLEPEQQARPGGGSHWISVGEGWKELICNLVDRLDALGLPYNVLQVKEKFGTLRFYAHCEQESQEFDRMVSRAERISRKICEDCGRKGMLRGDSWIRTLCVDCDRKFKDLRSGGKRLAQ